VTLNEVLVVSVDGTARSLFDDVTIVIESFVENLPIPREWPDTVAMAEVNETCPKLDRG
jgi:hypothetical protein